MHLSRPDIAAVVIKCLHKGVELGHYNLNAWVIMPNHVHILLHPKISPSLLLKSLKGASARGANRVLAQTGRPFWQKESYNRWVRDAREFRSIRTYIEQNPVKAGLVKRPEAFCWSSAGARATLFSVPTAATTTVPFPVWAPAQVLQTHW
jgi:REP element-mobilizing transposase RayT